MAEWRDEAEALARALELELVDVNEVIAWADSQVVAQAAPHWTLTAVASSRGRYPQDVAHGLRDLPGAADPASVRALLLQLVARNLRRDLARARNLARVLYFMALAQEIDDPELHRVALGAWDRFDLAAAGHVPDNPAEVLQSLRDVLEPASAAAARRGPRWRTD